MKYEMVDKAIEFLNGWNENIILQVPYYKDTKLVVDYILKEHNGFRLTSRRKNVLICNNYQIKIVSLNERSQDGYRCPIFFIDRKRDTSYYNWIDW